MDLELVRHSIAVQAEDQGGRPGFVAHRRQDRMRSVLQWRSRSENTGVAYLSSYRKEEKAGKQSELREEEEAWLLEDLIALEQMLDGDQ